MRLNLATLGLGSNTRRHLAATATAALLALAPVAAQAQTPSIVVASTTSTSSPACSATFCRSSGRLPAST